MRNNMKWKTLQHNGILFPPDFESKGIKIKIKGENVDVDGSGLSKREWNELMIAFDLKDKLI